MAQESVSETPDASSSCAAQSQPDPPFSRSLSFSRLNAQAPEFVPTRPTSRTDRQQPRLVVPQPPPPPHPGMVHVYSPPPTSPFHIPIRPHAPVGSHIVPVQSHHHHVSHQHPVHYHPHQHQYYVSAGGGGSGDQDSGLQSVQKSQVEPDHTPFKNKLSEEASQKILNQVTSVFIFQLFASLLDPYP